MTRSESDGFQMWLQDMDDAIDRFLAKLAPHCVERLDGRPRSLTDLEALVLASYGTPEDLLREDAAEFHDGAARYVGEIFRRGTGSRWCIELADKKKLYAGLPTLTGGSLQVALCPLTMLTTALDRRTGKHLRTIFQNVAAGG
jgi:hypothetical protein